MVFNKSLMLNLVGNTHNIYKSSIEIHNIAISQRFGSKIIENYDLINELNRNVRRDLLINKCNNFTFDQIKDLHYTMYDYRKQNIFSKILFIIDNPLMDNYTNNKCNIYNTYNINNSLHKKEEQIDKILYSNYNKFIN
jgi:hypothetical protein